MELAIILAILQAAPVIIPAVQRGIANVLAAFVGGQDTQQPLLELLDAALEDGRKCRALIAQRFATDWAQHLETLPADEQARIRAELVR